jgi:hypothetical protein
MPIGKFLHSISTALRERRDLVLEIVALRAQIDVLKRSTNRPRFSTIDRLFWILLSHCWDRWPQALEIVEPETVLRWRRRGRQPRWNWPWRGKRPGRPPIDVGTRRLIRRMSLDNFLWGAPRIHGELRMVGIHVAQSTVAKYMVRRPGPRSQTWRTFLRNHARELLPADVGAQAGNRMRDLYSAIARCIGLWFWVPFSMRCPRVPDNLPPPEHRAHPTTSTLHWGLSPTIPGRVYARGRGPPFRGPLSPFPLLPAHQAKPRPRGRGHAAVSQWSGSRYPSSALGINEWFDGLQPPVHVHQASPWSGFETYSFTNS